MSPEDKPNGPSLTERESSGGDTARRGFRYQDDIVLSYIPYWLSLEGFSEMISEAVGDVEAKFFVPGKGFEREFIEFKDKILPANEFWKEIDRFLQLHEEAPGTFRWFTLVSRGLSKDLHPLLNTLRRTRKPYGFYDDGSAIRGNSYRDFERRVMALGRTSDDARFLFERVLIRSDVSSVSGDPGLFISSIQEHLPQFLALPGTSLQEIASSLRDLIRRKEIGPINRLELEACFAKVPGGENLLESSPIRIDVQHGKDVIVGKDLVFDWAPFFGDADRRFPPPETWNGAMVGSLIQTRDWIDRWRKKKRILLKGNHRLSTFLAIGSGFSAVAGFALDYRYREETWSTDAHAAADTASYEWTPEVRDCASSGEIAVSIGVMRDIKREVREDLGKRGLGGIPERHIFGASPIVSAQHANKAVMSAKEIIAATARATGAKLIHLYVAGPAVFALFLGHRLNGTCDAQVYQWEAGTNTYMPACRLNF
jgi:hypothetical protein